MAGIPPRSSSNGDEKPVMKANVQDWSDWEQYPEEPPNTQQASNFSTGHHRRIPPHEARSPYVPYSKTPSTLSPNNSGRAHPQVRGASSSAQTPYATNFATCPSAPPRQETFSLPAPINSRLVHLDMAQQRGTYVSYSTQHHSIETVVQSLSKLLSGATSTKELMNDLKALSERYLIKPRTMVATSDAMLQRTMLVTIWERFERLKRERNVREEEAVELIWEEATQAMSNLASLAIFLMAYLRDLEQGDATEEDFDAEVPLRNVSIEHLGQAHKLIEERRKFREVMGRERASNDFLAAKNLELELEIRRINEAEAMRKEESDQEIRDLRAQLDQRKGFTGVFRRGE